MLFINVLMKENATGKTRAFEYDASSFDLSNIEDLSTLRYLWGDGNLSCDCNRGKMFAESIGDPDPELPCGDDAFRVRLTYNGDTLYDEFGIDK